MDGNQKIARANGFGSRYSEWKDTDYLPCVLIGQMLKTYPMNRKPFGLSLNFINEIPKPILGIEFLWEIKLNAWGKEEV